MEKYYLEEGKNDLLRIRIPLGNYSPLFIPNINSDVKSPDQTRDEHLSSDPKPSIIVLPFMNLTGEENQDFFVKGLTEELSIELTRYEDFRVIGYRIKDRITSEIESDDKLLQSLNANFTVSGSVRKDNEQIKISIKLSDTFTGEQLWGEQFKRKLDVSNLISIQEDIAREVVTIIANEYGIIPQTIAKEARKKAPKDLDTYEAILKYYHYQIHHTPETAQEAFIALEYAVSKNPDSGVALIMLASLYGTSYELDLPNNENALEKAIELINKGLELEPDSQPVRIAYAWSFFIQNQKERFFNEIQNALSLNPNSPFRVGMIGFFLSLYGDWEKGKELLDRAMNMNLGFPNWYYGATTLYYYRLNKYEKAFDEALKYDVPAIFWGPMLRIAILGQLDRQVDAASHILDLKKLKPDFEGKAHYLLRMYVKEEELIKKIIEGLRKAGLEISE